MCVVNRECGFVLQYEYFNAVLINERDEEGNYLELGKEFILVPNDHFNNLPVNISLSDVQVPTNMYNKGKKRAASFHHSTGQTKAHPCLKMKLLIKCV